MFQTKRKISLKYTRIAAMISILGSYSQSKAGHLKTQGEVKIPAKEIRTTLFLVILLILHCQSRCTASQRAPEHP